MQLRRRNILSIYNGTEGLARGKGRKTVSRAGARRFGQLSSPDVLAPVRHLRTPSLVRHLRTPIILTLPLVRKMQRNAGEKEKMKRPVQKQTAAGGKILKNPVSSDVSLKLITV